MLNFFKKKACGVCFYKACIWSFAFIFTISNHFLPVSLAFTVSPPSAETGLLFQNLKSLKIPSQIGRIQEFHLGTENKIVVLIQDAHAIADAQRNIHRLITFFQEKYRIKIVALEGASDQYDAHFFKSFPDQKFLQNTFEQIHEKGELSGGSAAALFNDTSGFYHGMEDWDLYQKGIDYFHQAVGLENKSLGEIDGLGKRLLKQKQVHYTPELLQVDQLLSDFRSDIYNFSAVLAELSKFRMPEEGSELELILKESRSNELNASVDAEIREIASLVKGALSSKDLSRRARTDLYEFNRKHQAYQTSSITAQSFALYLRDLVVKYKLKVKVSKELNYLVLNQRKMRDIKGTALFRQFETYAEAIMRGLISTKEQQSLYEQTKLLNIFRRLAKLELGQEDWAKLKTLVNNEAIRLSPSDGVIAYGEASRLLNLMQPNIRFYDIAERRDKVFYDRTTNLMQKRKDSAAIIVAGGFHTEGLTREFKEKGVSYLLLMPAIASIPERTHYREHMAGQVSWSDYFEVVDGQVSFYEAFLRYTRNLLIEKSKLEKGKLIKDWRDEIIRHLADENRIAEAHQYTRYLDELAQEAGFGGEDLKTKWLENINRFETEIKSMRERGLLNETGMRALFASMTSQSAIIANGLAPNARSEMRFVPYLKNLLGFSPHEAEVQVRAQYENDSEAAEKNASKIPSLLRYGPVSFNEAVNLGLTELERSFDSQIADDAPETSIHNQVHVVGKTILNPARATQLEEPGEIIRDMLNEYEAFQEIYQDFETGEQRTVDYFEHAASELLIGEPDRSPLLIMAEHGVPGFSYELQLLAERYGEDQAKLEMERRLNQGILVLMSTDGGEDYDEPFAGTFWKASTVTFQRRVPANVEAVFVPENLYDRVTSGLSPTDKQKVIAVEGQISLSETGVDVDGGPRAKFSPAEIAGGEIIRVPDWQKAVSNFMREHITRIEKPSRSYALYGSRTLTSNAKTLPRSEVRDAFPRDQATALNLDNFQIDPGMAELWDEKNIQNYSVSDYIDAMKKSSGHYAAHLSPEPVLHKRLVREGRFLPVLVAKERGVEISRRNQLGASFGLHFTVDEVHSQVRDHDKSIVFFAATEALTENKGVLHAPVENGAPSYDFPVGGISENYNHPSHELSINGLGILIISEDYEPEFRDMILRLPAEERPRYVAVAGETAGDRVKNFINQNGITVTGKPKLSQPLKPAHNNYNESKRGAVQGVKGLYITSSAEGQYFSIKTAEDSFVSDAREQQARDLIESPYDQVDAMISSGIQTPPNLIRTLVTFAKEDQALLQYVFRESVRFGLTHQLFTHISNRAAMEEGGAALWRELLSIVALEAVGLSQYAQQIQDLIAELESSKEKIAPGRYEQIHHALESILSNVLGEGLFEQTDFLEISTRIQTEELPHPQDDEFRFKAENVLDLYQRQKDNQASHNKAIERAQRALEEIGQTRSEIRVPEVLRRLTQRNSLANESKPAFESGEHMLRDESVRRVLSRYVENMDVYLDLFDYLVSAESSMSESAQTFIQKMIFERGGLYQLKKEVVKKVKKEKVTFEHLSQLSNYILDTVWEISDGADSDARRFQIGLEIQPSLEKYFLEKEKLSKDESFNKAVNVRNKLMRLFEEINLQLVPDNVKVYRSVPRPYIGRPGGYQQRAALQVSDFGVGARGLGTAERYADKTWDAIIQSTFGDLRDTGGIILRDRIAAVESAISLAYQGTDSDLKHKIIKEPAIEKRMSDILQQPLSGESAVDFIKTMTRKNEEGNLLGERTLSAFQNALNSPIELNENARNTAIRAYLKAISEFFEEMGFPQELQNNVVGAPENYSLEEHTEMVLGQFIDYRLEAFRVFHSSNNLPDWFSENFFMLFLALHDIGKTFAFKDGETDLQYGNSQKIVDALFDALELPQGAKTLALSLLSEDPLGDYFRGSMTAKSETDLNYFTRYAAERIDDLAKQVKEYGISREAFFEILAMYYQSDASSYTENARTLDSWARPDSKQGMRALDDLFDFNKTDALQTIFSSQLREEEGEVFSMEERFQSLRKEFASRSEMRDTAKDEQEQSALVKREEDVLKRELERAFFQHPEFRDIHNRLKIDENLFYANNELAWMQNHVRRVVIMASSVWRQAVKIDPQLEGMENDVNLLIIGADLHDVGKMDIPVKILTKPARLEPNEREAMEDHVLAGINKIAVSVNKQNEEASNPDDVISDEKFSRLANIIQFHHPSYPFSDRFIQESETDPLLRVLPVVDAFEAMTGSRGYSKGMNPFKALELLRKEAEAGVLDLQIINALAHVLGSAEEPKEITNNLFPELSGGRSETREWAVVRSIVLDSIGQFNETLRYLKSEESKVDFLFSYVLPSNDQFLRLDSSSDRRNFTRHKGGFNVENSVKWALAWQSRLNLFYLYQDSSDKDDFMRVLQEKAQSLDLEMNGGKPLYDYFVKDFQSYSWMELHRRVELKELENLVEFGIALNTAGNISYKDAGDYPASAAARETSLNEKEGTSYDAILAYKQPSFRFEERSYAGVGMPHEGWETMPEGYEHDRITRNKTYEKGDLSSMSADSIDIDTSIEMSKAASEAGFIDNSTLKQALDLLEKLKAQREKGVERSDRSEMRSEKASQAPMNLTELQSIGSRAVDVLRPGSARNMDARDMQKIMQLSPSNFDRFVQTMRDLVDKKIAGFDALDGSAVLSTQLKVVQALLSTVGVDARGPGQELSLAINFTEAVDHSSFFSQLFQAIEKSGAQGEIFSNAESHRELARTLEPALRSLINLRKLKDSDFQIGGIIGSGDISNGIALALDSQSALSELNELFLGLVFSDSRANLSEDEQFANEALFAAFLMKTADILRNDEYQDILRDRLRSAEGAQERIEIRAEYLKGVLIAELTKVLGATYPNLENAIESGSGRLTFDGGLIAGIIATYRGEIEASMSA